MSFFPQGLAVFIGGYLANRNFELSYLLAVLIIMLIVLYIFSTFAIVKILEEWIRKGVFIYSF